jgi:hypothetical protein
MANPKSESYRVILIIALCGHEMGSLPYSAPSEEDVQSLIKAGIGLIFGKSKPVPSPDDYVAVDWDTLEVISETSKISKISGPSIVLLLPNMPLLELQDRAANVKEWVTQGEMRSEVEKHFQFLGIVQQLQQCDVEAPKIAIQTAQPRLGSKERPFELPQECISFLESDHPEKYVFRGQRREYDLPLLPSGYRRYFRPAEFPPTYDGPPIAGISYLDVEISEDREEEILKFISKMDMDNKYSGIIRGDGITGWDVLESPPQDFFRQFSKLSYKNAVECQALGDMCVYMLIDLFGQKLGLILAQQYGLSSALLDATTDPEVALFFAAHKPPYYWPVGLSDELGVIYRWPRESAIIGEEILKPMEGNAFQSVGASFKNYVTESKGLFTYRDDGVWKFDEKNSAKLLPIVIRGEERYFPALVFSEGDFKRSRMGRQHGAFLNPFIQPVPFELPGENGPNYPQKMVFDLIGDLLKTHQGEAFYFQHSAKPLDLGPIDKFYLWPIQEHPDFSVEKLKNSDTVHIAQNTISFQDKYLELLFLLLSPWSPILLLLISNKGYGKLKSKYIVARVNVHPGFAIHPKEAPTIARRLLNKDISQQRDEHGICGQGPISFPISMFVEEHLEEDFYKALAESTREILRLDKCN